MSRTLEFQPLHEVALPSLRDEARRRSVVSLHGVVDSVTSCLLN